MSVAVDDTPTKAEEKLIDDQKVTTQNVVLDDDPIDGMQDRSVGIGKALVCRVQFQRYLLLGTRCVMVRTKASLLQAARYFTNAQIELKTILSTSHLKSDPPRGFSANLSTSGQHMRFARVLLPLERLSPDLHTMHRSYQILKQVHILKGFWRR